MLTDICGSICVGLVLSIVIGFIAAMNGDVSPAHIAALLQNFTLKLTGLFGTTLFTALGGYVAARMARLSPLANSLAVGIVSFVLAITSLAVFPGVSPPWKIIAGCIVTIPAALLGGYFAARSQRI